MGAVLHHAKLCRARIIFVVEDGDLSGPARATITQATVKRVTLGKAGTSHAMWQHKKDGGLVHARLRSRLWGFLLQF